MNLPRIWTFFYGSYINFDVLNEIGFVPEKWEVGKLSGFDISIRPLANLVRSDQHCVYGVMAQGTHDELERLYAHAKDVLGEVYLPEAVLVETIDGKVRPALCYICPQMEPKAASREYVERIANPARKLGFPEWYILKLESFVGETV